MVAMLANLIWHLCARVTNKPQQPPKTDEDVPPTEEQTGSDDKQNNQSTQTTHVEPETLISLRRQIKQLEAQNVTHTLVPCKVCAHDLGQDLYEEAEAESAAGT